MPKASPTPGDAPGVGAEMDRKPVKAKQTAVLKKGFSVARLRGREKPTIQRVARIPVAIV